MDIYARFGQHASQILQHSGSQYATLKVRVHMWTLRVFSSTLHLREKLVSIRFHSPQANTVESNMKIN